MKIPFQITLLCASLAIVSCSNSSSKVDAAKAKPTVQTEVKRDTTTTWAKQEKRGAAISQSSYVDVLGRRKTESYDYHPPAKEVSPSEYTSIVTNPTQHALNNSGVSYTIYEKSRWSRFCGAGKMDKNDIAFILKEGVQNIPEELVSTCRKPTWSLNDFDSAWNKKCLGSTLTPAENDIVLYTVQPKKCSKPE